LVFRGHLRSIGHPQGMMSYLWTNQVYLKNFGDHVEKVTQRVKEASLAAAKAGRRPVKYLNSSQLDKETIARNILAQDGVRNGLVCVLSCIEPCWKFEIHRNRMTKKLELKLGPNNCLFLDPGKKVVLLQVIETSGLHLSRQPFPSVQADLILKVSNIG
jgi:hypothetical protein